MITNIYGPWTGGYYSWHDALGHFLASQAEVGLNAAALAELVRMQQLIARNAERDADTSGMPVVARYMGVGYTCAKS